MDDHSARLMDTTVSEKPVTDSPPVCDYEGSTYQADFWDTGLREYEDRAERIALRAMLPNRGNLFIEIGVGAGRQTPLLSAFAHVVALDYSRTQLQQARTRLGARDRYTFVAANVYQLPFAPAVFDGGMMVRVIHHLADAPAALKEIRSILADGATFILEYANKQNLKSILRYGLRRQSWSPFAPEPIEFVKLNFDFHPRAIREWLTGLGFRIAEQRTVSYFRVGAIKRLVPAGALAAIDGVLQLTGGVAQLSPSVFVKAILGGAPSDAAPPGGEIESIFRCPVCKGALQRRADEMLCDACGKRWGIKDGIYDFKEPL